MSELRRRLSISVPELPWRRAVDEWPGLRQAQTPEGEDKQDTPEGPQEASHDR